MFETINRMPVRVVLIDDNASYLEKIQAWCDAHRIAFDRTRHVFVTIGEFDTYLAAPGQRMPHIIVLDDDFSNARDEREKRRKGLDYLKSLERSRRYNTVVVFGSSEIDKDRATSAVAAGANFVVPKTQWGEHLEEYLEDAYQLVLRRSANPALEGTIRSVETGLRREEKLSGMQRCLLLITPFPGHEDQKLRDILSTVETAAAAEGFFATLAKMPPDQPTTIKELVRSYMHVCSRGIAVFYRRPGDQAFNANVALEIGYMLALDKPVLLLNFLEDVEVPSDLQGVVCPVLTGEDLVTPLARAVRDWLAD